MIYMVKNGPPTFSAIAACTHDLLVRWASWVSQDNNSEEIHVQKAVDYITKAIYLEFKQGEMRQHLLTCLIIGPVPFDKNRRATL